MTLLDLLRELAAIVTAADRRHASLQARAKVAQEAARRAAIAADNARTALDDYEWEARGARIDAEADRRRAAKAEAEHQRGVDAVESAGRGAL